MARKFSASCRPKTEFHTGIPPRLRHYRVCSAGIRSIQLSSRVRMSLVSERSRRAHPGAAVWSGGRCNHGSSSGGRGRCRTETPLMIGPTAVGIFGSETPALYRDESSYYYEQYCTLSQLSSTHTHLHRLTHPAFRVDAGLIAIAAYFSPGRALHALPRAPQLCICNRPRSLPAAWRKTPWLHPPKDQARAGARALRTALPA